MPPSAFICAIIFPIVITSALSLIPAKTDGRVFFYQYFISLLGHSGNRDQFSHLIFQSQFQVQTIWSSTNDFLVQFQVSNLKVYEESIHDNDSLMMENLKNFLQVDIKPSDPFLVHFTNQKIDAIYLSNNETTFSANFKIGIATLFQFQFKEGESTEIDPTTKLRTINYTSKSPTLIFKTAYETSKHMQILEPNITTNLKIYYKLDSDKTFFKEIVSNESITIETPISDKYFINNLQQINFIESEVFKLPDGDNMEFIIENVEKYYNVKFEAKKDAKFIITEIPKVTENNFEKTKTFLNKNSKFLAPNFLATEKSAGCFLNLYNLAKKLSSEELAIIVYDYPNIRLPIIDMLGFLGTEKSHSVAKTVLDFKSDTQLDQVERYLWALSIGQKPNGQNIVKDLLLIVQDNQKDLNTKLLETLLLTITAIASTFKNHKIYIEVESYLFAKLDKSQNIDERIMIINSLLNLKSENCVPILKNIIEKDPRKKIAAKAMKVIQSLPKSYWKYEELREFYFETLYELRRKHDSSSRIFALDVILEMEHDNEHTLLTLLNYLLSSAEFEVKQYLIQKIQILANNNKILRDRISKILTGNPLLKYYGVILQPGLSTIIHRSYYENTDSNCTIKSIQEIHEGVVKRGIVHIDLSYSNQTYQLLNLGIFSSGLSSFISSSSSDDDNEDITAGMEISILGKNIRPFVFFKSNGELIGHVWSGTASEKTPALQQMLILNDYEKQIVLRSGLFFNIKVQSSASFDLSGQIEISLWNRNSNSAIEKQIGIVMKREILINTPIKEVIHKFNTILEPKLDLLINADFSSEICLCLRLRQPNLLIRRNYVSEIRNGDKTESVTKKVTYEMPGKTYNLNEKNNKMCNKILNK